MKKNHLKKLALLGLSSGLFVASQASAAPANEKLSEDYLLLAGSCGAKCGGMKSRGCGAGACGAGRNKSCGANQACGARRSCGAKCGSLKASCGAHSCSSLTADSEEPGTKNPYASPNQSKANEYDPNDGNMNYHLMSEQELMMELNPRGIEMYKSLTPEAKAIALKVASMKCNGTNPCKGYGACKTDKNNCAGQNMCQGQGKCAVADKNLAVKLVYNKMMKEKRENAIQR